MQIPVHKVEERNLFIEWRDIKIIPGNIEQAHRHDYFQLMFIEKVKGSHEIDFQNYTAANASLHFVGKGRVHKVDFENDVIGNVIIFPETIFTSSNNDLQLLASFTFFNNGAFPILKLFKNDLEKITQLLKQLKQSLDSFEMSKHLLFALLIFVRELYNKSVGKDQISKDSYEIIEFKQLLKKHMHEWNTVDDYTQLMGLTNMRLNSICKQAYGKTALGMLHESKLLKAKRELVYTTNQVKEVAYNCGFEDVAYFNRFFKKHTGCTPLSFRNNH